MAKNAEKSILIRYGVCAVPKTWSKYTTTGDQISAEQNDDFFWWGARGYEVGGC